MSNINWKCTEFKTKDIQTLFVRVYGHVPNHIPDEQVEKYLREKYDIEDIDEGKSIVTTSFSYGKKI